MSVQTNQYVMYGVMLNKEDVKKWHELNNPEDEWDKNFNDRYEEYCQDSAYDNKIGGKDGLFCLTDPMSGRYIMIGEVIAKERDGEYIDNLEIPQRTNDDGIKLYQRIKEVFGINWITQGCKMYVITNYR